MPETSPQLKLKEQFVIETIPVGFPWRLFIFAFTLFIFSLFVFFGLRFGYSAYVNSQASALDKKIEDLAEQVSEEEQESFINFYSQLVNLKKILDRHEFTANIFEFLEKNTLGEVYYTDANFSSAEDALNLKGIAARSEVLVGQLQIFDEQTEVDRIQLNQMNTDRGGVSFGLTIFFNSDFFKKPAL